MFPNIKDHQYPEHRVDIGIMLLDLHNYRSFRSHAERKRSPP